jgi:hypothetical protein
MRVRSAWPLLALAACSSETAPTQPDDLARLRVLQGVEYAADTRVMESFPVQLATAVTVTNRTGSPVTLTFPDGCVVTLRAYSGDRQVWDQRILILCHAARVEVTLPPGGSRTFETRTDAAQVLGGTLPDGRYRIEAVLHPSGETVRLDAGVVDLAIHRTAGAG